MDENNPPAGGNKVAPINLDDENIKSLDEHKKAVLTDRRLSASAQDRRKAELEELNSTQIGFKDLPFRAKGLYIWNHVAFTMTLTILVLVAMGMLFASLFNVADTQFTVTLDYVIVGIFTFETLMRCIFMGPKAYFTDFLCVVDFLVSVIDIVTIVIGLTGSGTRSDEAVLVRTFRVARLSKISRIARLSLKVDEIENSERGESIEKDEDGHIYAYNSATLFSLGWLYNIQGTVIVMPEIWVQTLIFVILTTMIAAYACDMECDPLANNYDDGAANCEGCINSIEADYILMFLELAAFLLGIFAQLLFDRWWETRTLIQMLFAEIKDSCMMAYSFIRGNDKKSERVRRDLIRWSKLGAFLLEKQIDGKTNFREAIEKRYLKESEWDQMEDRERGNFILPQQWAFDTVCRMVDDNLVVEYGGCLDNLIMSFLKQRNLCSDILMILETPMPYIFTHLMTIICKVNLLFTSIACGVLVGQSLKNEQWTTVACGYMIVILGNMLIEGLLRLHVVLSDPFGDDACDFPWQSFMDELDDECEIMKSQFSNMPYGDKYDPIDDFAEETIPVEHATDKEPPNSGRTILPPLES